MKSIISAAISSALLLSTRVSAFKYTTPLLLWSSTPNAALADVTADMKPLMSAADVYDTIKGLGCDWATLVLVHVDELHHSQIPGLKLPSSPDLHIPYMTSPSRATLDSKIESWASFCGASVVSTLQGAEGKSILLIDAKKDDDLDDVISSAKLSLPHILVVTSTNEKRQEEKPLPEPKTSITKTLSATASATATPTSTRTAKPTSTSTSIPKQHHNSTIPPSSAPLLQRYQLLTTPIITALLISFLIFVPIVAFGVYALVGIQVPPRMMEISKGLVGREKKDQ